MKRKLIKQANQAYTITLPIEWVRENNLDNKTELDLEIENNCLIITTNNKPKLISKRVNVEGFNERNISRVIKSMYAKGVDELELSSKNDISSTIIKHLHDSLGYALVGSKNGCYKIKDLGGSSYEDLDEIFKRVFQMVLSFYDSAILDMFGKEIETIEGLIARDIEINKFCLYLQRSINKKHYKDTIDAKALFTFSFALEKIADEIQRLWRSNILYKPKKTDEIKKVSKKVFDCLEKSFTLFYQFNPLITEELVKIRDSVREDYINLNKNKYINIMARHLVKISEECADLSHLTLMMKT